MRERQRDRETERQRERASKTLVFVKQSWARLYNNNLSRFGKILRALFMGGRENRQFF